VDERLLAEAEQAGAAVEPVRHEVAAARLELARLERILARKQVRFGNAVRRLHDSGASLPEIARSLGLTDELVERIVKPSTYTSVIACSFCGAERSLVAGPGVYICSGCVELAEDVGGGGATERTVAMRLQSADDREPCSFCGKRREQVEFVVEGVGARVCNECLDLSDDILGEAFEV
jgi:ATP-dependent Clp protease ATP-binding subunit ClpX